MNNDYGDHPDRRTTYPDSPYSEDESTPLQTGSNQALGRNIATEAKGWNVFRDLPPKNDSVSTMNENFAELTIKFLKVLVYLLVFVIVLGSSVISLGTVLLMTSQLRQDRTTVYCNRELGKLKTFVTTLPDEERLTWIWCIIIAFVIPEIGTLIRSVRMCLFKTRVKPRVLHFVFVAIMETFHVVGLAIMFLSVLPELDVIQGVILTGAVYFVPGLLGLLSRNKERDESRRYYLAVLDIAAVATQATAFVLTPLHEVSNPSLWLVPVALFLISCGWWENYVSVQSSMILIRTLAQIKREMKSARYFTYAFVSVWKIIVFFLSTMIILHSQSQDFNLFTMIGSIFSNHNITVSEVEATVGGGTIPDLSDVVPDGTSVIMSTEFTTPIFVLLIQVLSSYFAYIVGKFACKIMIQEFSYALSVNLTIPVSISLLIAACALRDNDPCYFHGTIPDYLSYESPVLSALGDFIVNEYAWVWFLWLLSQTWITLHIWTPKCERLAATEKLFVTPMYNGLLINQSLGLNRNRDDQPEAGGDDFMKPGKEKSDTEDDTVFPPPPTDIRKSDFVTKIYVCATMWHENKEEMLEFLKSILRMDQDQCARKNAQNYLNIVDPDYYEFETHIFFDDAFEMADHDENESQVNQFVRLLVDVLDEAASKIHQTQIHVRAPKKYPTPYGGRLVWTLPGNTKMITHLKDKSKIRHRKRWSQVMYMYYLLGHRIMDLPISIPRKEVIAENTYLLALDGDIDFQPSAVKLLVDLMKKNKGLGAACGRIHPVGTGPMVWYQMFEYAVGHWLQKATEHVIGCVLCSPGCFSLFRAKALMDDNVMKKYTTPPTEARHYVQYDQGEDRWLCTLLLQRGYRVEYSAASDAYTHAPEGFYEFYNQRRRWVPSTMANIMDLIGDYKRTVKNNDNISMMYMGYQVLLMGGTILGPGTIFLMLIGACNAAFRLALLTCFYWNFAPIVIFIIVCFTCKSEIQLFVAAVISVAYGLVMMAVIVGILLQTAEDGWLAPSTLFFFLIVGQLVIAGIIHPQELICLPCGIMYYVTIPSMYMLLVIYSITNLNNVTWGTREVQVKKTLAELEEDKKKLEEAKQKASPNSFLSFLRNGGDSKNDDQGSLEFSFAGLCKCVFCMHGKPSDEKLQLVAVTECLEKVLDRLNTMDKPKDSPGQMTGWNRIPSRFTQTPMNPIDEHPVLDEQPPSDSESTVSQNTDTNRKRTFLISPYWLDDESLKKGEVGFLTAKEEQFWDDLIEEYLFPIDEDKAEKARIASDLKDLRNNSSFAFFMVNALFVLILFLMQLNQDQIHIEWPFGASVAISFDLDNLEVHITREYLQLEPIGLAFVSSFGLILAIQFLAMLIHRFGTFAHILASTKLRGAYWCKKPEDLSDESLHSKDAIEIVKDLQRLDVVEDSYSEIGDDNKPARRKTVRILEKGRRTTQNVSNNLDDAFRQRFFSTDENSGLPRKMSARRSTKAFKAFEARRSTVIAERKKSKNDTGGNAVYEASRNPTTLQLGSARTGRPSVDRNYNHRHSAGVVNLAYEPEGSI